VAADPFNFPNYDVSPDGRRFLMLKAADEDEGTRQMVVVQNWLEELKQRMAAGKKRLAGRDDSQGSGVGLSISRSIIESHGGRLWADDNPPRGARFCFTLLINGESRDQVVPEDRVGTADDFHANNPAG
jgi:hypothetical protein